MRWDEERVKSLNRSATLARMKFKLHLRKTVLAPVFERESRTGVGNANGPERLEKDTISGYRFRTCNGRTP